MLRPSACLPFRAEESVGGLGSHGRKRRTAGHVKAVLSRAQVTVQVCWPLLDCGAGIAMTACREGLSECLYAQQRLSAVLGLVCRRTGCGCTCLASVPASSNVLVAKACSAKFLVPRACLMPTAP